jgi:hypothetical protein
MTTTTTTLDDMRGGYIDSLDIIARLAELEEAAGEEPSDFGCAHCREGSHPDDEIPALCPECAEELTALRSIADEGGSTFSDWEYGVSLIPEDKFEDYAREYAEDVGAIDGNESNPWPLYCIDWERAADDLKVDYSTIRIEGETYLGR